MLQDNGNKDDELIKSFQQTQNREAFSKLISKHKNTVFNFCFRYLGNYDDADDCTQEIFIKLFHNLHSFKFQSKFSTWLYRIIINTCKDLQGSKYKRQLSNVIRLSTYSIQNESRAEVDIVDHSQNPENILKNKELGDLINKAINKLKGKQKTVLLLRDIEGRSYEEIAEIAELNLGTVKSNLARARIKLAGILKNQIVK